MQLKIAIYGGPNNARALFQQSMHSGCERYFQRGLCQVSTREIRNVSQVGNKITSSLAPLRFLQKRGRKKSPLSFYFLCEKCVRSLAQRSTEGVYYFPRQYFDPRLTKDIPTRILHSEMCECENFVVHHIHRAARNRIIKCIM